MIKVVLSSLILTALFAGGADALAEGWEQGLKVVLVCGAVAAGLVCIGAVITWIAGDL